MTQTEQSIPSQKHAWAALPSVIRRKFARPQMVLIAHYLLSLFNDYFLRRTGYKRQDTEERQLQKGGLQ